MTVGELIALLSKCPPSSLLVFVDDAPHEGEYDRVRVEVDGDETRIVVE